jgi:twinkle protein
VKQQKDKPGLKYEIPTLYSISGSANFNNKADYGITVYRNFQEPFHSEIHVQKVKFRHLGEGGTISQIFDKSNGRYKDVSDLSNANDINIIQGEPEQSTFQFADKWGSECPY